MKYTIDKTEVYVFFADIITGELFMYNNKPYIKLESGTVQDSLDVSIFSLKDGFGVNLEDGTFANFLGDDRVIKYRNYQLILNC